MGLFKRAADKIAHERESMRMGREHLRQVKEQSPELFVKGYWRMTPEQARAEVRRQQRKS
ncbi:hypothetical protein ACQEVC_45320 [Plantactinospora sp. CA-294935]|uniref:hypothetical protein n=1 Tax=Plantactinospora sp. CA-294935 TaxID=3240012 RepID=UPI003D913B48